MLSKEPLTREVNWLFVLPQFVVIALLSVICYLVMRPDSLEPPILTACVIYLIYSYGARGLLCQAQQQGIQLANREEYQQAIAKFEQSYNFFTKYKWIDRFRAFTLMSPSAISYREMALVNIAYCYARLRNAAQAQAYYRKALAEFPNSKLAQKGLQDSSGKK